MTRALSFIHQGVRYVTLFCDNDYLKTVLEENSNVADTRKIQGSSGLNKAFKNEFGQQLRDVPTVAISEINVVDGKYTVSGTAVIDGVDKVVTILPDCIKVEGEDPVEETTEHAPEPEVEVPTVVTGEQIEESKTVDVQEDVVVPPKIPITESVEEESNTQGTNSRDLLLAASTSVGVTIGTTISDGITSLCTPSEIVICSGSNNKAGVYFGEMYEKRQPQFSHPTVKQKVQDAKVIKKEESDEQVPEVPEEEKLMNAWRATSEPDTTEKWQPPTISEEEIERHIETAEKQKTEETEDSKALKEKLRATFSEEVNAVIGDIPHSILGSITEFTTNPIDADTLKERGHLYCIDNRWHKCGNWYCIDVVNDMSRFFYNSKNNIAIEIPIGNCRDWLAAVSKEH